MVKMSLEYPNRVRLLVRLDANKNPNRQDYLMRLARENSLNGIADLSQIFRLSFSSLVALSDHSLNELIAGRTDYLQFDYPKKRWGLVSGGWSLRRRGWVKEARVCPSCLVEDRMQPVCFNFSMPIVCPHHGLLPIDFCPCCGVTLTYMRKSIHHCDCGFLLTRSVGNEKPEWLTGLYAIFSPWHLTHVGAHYDLVNCAERDWLAARLVVFVSKGFEKTYPTTYITSADFDEIRRLITDWPAIIWSNLPLIKNDKKGGRRWEQLIEIGLVRDNKILNDVIKGYEEYRR